MHTLKETQALRIVLSVSSCVFVAIATEVIAVEPVNWPPAGVVDDARLDHFGLRVLRSKHCVLVTDLATSPAVDELPHVIDVAVPLWSQRFNVQQHDAAAWRVRVCLMADDARFEAAGLMPIGREVGNGLALGYEFWLRDQPSDYYRRCLLLHEATHSFMMTQLGGCGPAWYMEGMAELLGAHAWRQETGELELGIIPANKLASPMWGRIKLLRDAFAQGQVNPVEVIMKIDNRVALDVESYAWAWALAVFCDQHPRYQQPWRGLYERVLDDDFDRLFFDNVALDRKRFAQDWRYFLGTLDYGYDLPRAAIRFREGEPLSHGVHTVTIDAALGWQSSGVRVEAGKRRQITASGQYVVGRDDESSPWPCEPGGITLEYCHGRPLGELLLTVDHGTDAFLRGKPIGRGGQYLPDRSGTLYFRINDAPNRLAENEGSAEVTIAVD